MVLVWSERWLQGGELQSKASLQIKRHENTW